MKRFNFDEFLWFIVLIFIDLGLIYLIITGKVELYIGKKMIKYIYIAIVMLSIISAFQITNIFTPIDNNKIKIKLIPILLALIIGLISVNEQHTFKHIELNKELTESYRDIHVHDHNNDALIKQNISYNNINEPIIVDEKNPMILEDIRLNPDNYIGKQIEVHGFVCKENYLNKNQFIIGRTIMTCCAADSKIVGIIGEGGNIEGLIENQDVCATGIISYSNISDNDGTTYEVPIIEINNLELEDKK